MLALGLIKLGGDRSQAAGIPRDSIPRVTILPALGEKHDSEKRCCGLGSSHENGVLCDSCSHMRPSAI